MGTSALGAEDGGGDEDETDVGQGDTHGQDSLGWGSSVCVVIVVVVLVLVLVLDGSSVHSPTSTRSGGNPSTRAGTAMTAKSPVPGCT